MRMTVSSTKKNNFGLTAGYCKYCRRLLIIFGVKESYESSFNSRMYCVIFEEGKGVFLKMMMIVKAVRILMDNFPSVFSK